MAYADSNIVLYLSALEAAVIQALLSNVVLDDTEFGEAAGSVSNALETVGVSIDANGSDASDLADHIFHQLGEEGISLNIVGDVEGE